MSQTGNAYRNYKQERETAHEVQWTSVLRRPERQRRLSNGLSTAVLEQRQKRTSFTDVFGPLQRARDARSSGPRFCADRSGSGDIRTVRARPCSNNDKKGTSFTGFFEIRARDGARGPVDLGFAPTGAAAETFELRITIRSGHKEKRHPLRMPLFFMIASARRDSNPRPPPWQGGAPPLSHSRIRQTFVLTETILPQPSLKGNDFLKFFV